jgi:hypothetical protein
LVYDGWEFLKWIGHMSIRKRVRKAWGDLQIQTISTTKVEQLLLKHEQASSTSTRKHYLATLYTILR